VAARRRFGSTGTPPWNEDVVTTNTVARSLNDIGLAGWFGGSLMGAVAVNRAPTDVEDQRDRSRFANGVWRRWWKVQVGCMTAAAVGGIGLTAANKGRIATQRGVAATAAAKAAMLTAATVTTLYADVLGKRMDAAGPTPIDDATTPTEATDDDVARAQQQLRLLQWAVPAMLAAILVLDARLGEQQRPKEVLRGLRARIR